jgi:hypothetical protein
VYGNAGGSKYPLLFTGSAAEVHRAPPDYWVLEGNQRLNGSRKMLFEVDDFVNTPPAVVAQPPPNVNPPTFTTLNLLFWVDSSDNYPRQVRGEANNGKAGNKAEPVPATHALNLWGKDHNEVANTQYNFSDLVGGGRNESFNNVRGY